MNRDALDEASYQARVRTVRALLGRRQADAAAEECEAIKGLTPQRVEPLLLLARARQQQGRFDDMLELCEKAVQLDPQHVAARLQFAEACLFCCRHDRARQQLNALEDDALRDAALLQHVAQLYAHMGRHADAHRCHSRAAELRPDDPQALYNLASSQVAMGELQAAEESFDEVLAIKPDDYDAWQNRSALRRQTADDNHIPKLLAQLGKLSAPNPGEVPLYYALAKEYEDLGDYESSFRFLAQGARQRRGRLSYDVAGDVDVMRRIAERFGEEYLNSEHSGDSRPGPVFVLGLPRSGTTLVDRILSSHSQVESLGEINDFALTLTRLGRTGDKNRLLDAAVAIDPQRLGSAYIDGVATYGRDCPLLIDKTPANYLYIGLIAKALPAAKIVHLKRHPVDSCLAMYRTLFRMGYPFSYDLEDLASYYLAYDALMRHWDRVLPQRVHHVSYERLVERQEEVSRELLEYCGLPWEDGVLQFERNAAPVATASAAQVRQPIYRDALARWRRYERQLAPLIERLEGAGVAI
ncbi:MAG: sulfotransferase [Pseudomonadota bacterium]